MEYIAHALKNHHIQRLIAVIASDLVVFSTINASQATVWQLFIGFGLAVATFYCLIDAIGIMLKQFGWKQPYKRLIVYSTLVCGGLLAIKSSGGLGIRDIIVLTLLTIIGCFYISYNKSAARQQSADTKLL